MASFFVRGALEAMTAMQEFGYSVLAEDVGTLAAGEETEGLFMGENTGSLSLDFGLQLEFDVGAQAWVDSGTGARVLGAAARGDSVEAGFTNLAPDLETQDLVKKGATLAGAISTGVEAAGALNKNNPPQVVYQQAVAVGHHPEFIENPTGTVYNPQLAEVGSTGKLAVNATNVKLGSGTSATLNLHRDVNGFQTSSVRIRKTRVEPGRKQTEQLMLLLLLAASQTRRKKKNKYRLRV